MSVTLAAILLASQAVLCAESPSPVPRKVEAEELASRKASVVALEDRIGDRERQLRELVDDIERLDGRIEGRVARIVESLEKMRDSQDSKIRVARMKQEVMEKLGESVERYQRGRKELGRELVKQAGGEGEEILKAGMKRYDEKIERRVGQIVDLSKSFTEHQDFEKYELDSAGYSYYGNDWGWQNSRVSEEWKQNRRETKQTDKQRKQLVSALEESIEVLRRRSKSLSGKLQGSGLSEAEAEVYREELTRTESALRKRTEQLAGVMSLSEDQPATEAVSRSHAHDTEMMIREAAEDIRSDFADMKRKYTELKKRAKDLIKLENNLKARKEWLAAYDKAHGE